MTTLVADDIGPRFKPLPEYEKALIEALRKRKALHIKPLEYRESWHDKKD